MQAAGRPCCRKIRPLICCGSWTAAAVENDVTLQNNSGMRSHTDQFFTEQELTLSAIAREKGLVGLLYGLGSGQLDGPGEKHEPAAG